MPNVSLHVYTIPIWNEHKKKNIEITSEFVFAYLTNDNP